MLFFFYETIQKSVILLARILLPVLVNERARRFVESRKPTRLFATIEKARLDLTQYKAIQSAKFPVLWVHISSAGEIEQAIPPLRLMVERLGARVFLTYFSVSAEPFIKNVPGLLAAMPFALDVEKEHLNIMRVLEISHLFCVRYDLWPSLLRAARKQGVATHLLAATHRSARRDPIPWLWNIFRTVMYRHFDSIFAVNEDDLTYFSTLGLRAKSVLAGDPKWARAKQRAAALKENGLSTELSAIERALSGAKMGRKLLVLGSPHNEEHAVMLESLAAHSASALLFYVPHDIGCDKILSLANVLRATNLAVVTMSDLLSRPALLEDGLRSANVIIVDRMGMLAELYSLADLAIVGGGFDGQIHNTLEPAAHPVATAFGSNVRRAPEAKLLLQEKAALGFANPKDMVYFLMEYLGAPADAGKVHDADQRLALCRDSARRLFSRIPDTSELVCERIAKMLQAN